MFENQGDSRRSVLFYLKLHTHFFSWTLVVILPFYGLRNWKVTFDKEFCEALLVSDHTGVSSIISQ